MKTPIELNGKTILVTGSPGFMPSFKRALAARMDPSRMSRKVNVFSSPASLTHSMAFCSGQRRAYSSTTSRAKLKFSGMCTI